ncbi:MAG: hypothetical protein WED11_05615 [Natronospirillum sp.]
MAFQAHRCTPKSNDHIEQLITWKVYIPEATRYECQAYFTTNPERFVTSPLLDVSHILIAGKNVRNAQCKVVARGQNMLSVRAVVLWCRDSGCNPYVSTTIVQSNGRYIALHLRKLGHRVA